RLWKQQTAERARQLEESQRQWREAPPGEDAEAMRARIKAETETTIPQLHRMLDRETHPTWMHAAYADLAARMMHLEMVMQELGDSLSLLHSKVEMLIVQQALGEQQRHDD